MCRFLQNKIIQHPTPPNTKKKKEKEKKKKAIVGSLVVVDGTLTGGKLKLNFHG